MDGLSFAILDKAGEFQCLVGAHRGAEATIVSNGVSQASFVLDDDAEARDAIAEPGARAIAYFKDGEEFRGRISARPGAGPDGYFTTYVQDDRRKLHTWLGWQKPTAAITAQTDEYRVYTGPTETVVKTAIAEAVARLGAPWTISPSLGRGLPNQYVEFRQHPLDDKLLPLLRTAGIGIRLAYTGDVPTLDINTPRTVVGELTPETGRLDSYSYSDRAPAATRAVVGGRGQGVDRVFRLVIDADLEAEYGDIIEIFVDSQGETPDELEAAGRTKLAEGRPSVTVSLELADQPGFEYRSTYDVGDLVPLNIGVPTTQIISQVRISDDPRTGVTVTPQVGDLELDEPARLMKQLSRLQARTRDLGRR